MKKLKRLIRKLGGQSLQNLIISCLRITRLNNKFILFSLKRAKKQRVNLGYWSEAKNLGDTISPVIVRYMAERNQIDMDCLVSRTKHLFSVGSVITAGCQDCTIWGSGILNTRILSRLRKRELDVRSVRGPLTRLILLEYGYEVPESYGDPAILMPLIYNPNVPKKYDIGVITHMDEPIEIKNTGFHQISILTDDYETFVKEIKASKLVVSSSLHGIIFAEIYGVPAILLRPGEDLFKYYDFYYSTGRYEFPIADNLEEVKNITPPEIPDYSAMQEAIADAFPGDLWEQTTKQVEKL